MNYTVDGKLISADAYGHETWAQRIDLTSGSDAGRIRYLRKIQAEHIAIYDAIRLQNIKAARNAARLHLFNARHRYEEATHRSCVAPRPRDERRPE